MRERVKGKIVQHKRTGAVGRVVAEIQDPPPPGFIIGSKVIIVCDADDESKTHVWKLSNVVKAKPC